MGAGDRAPAPDTSGGVARVRAVLAAHGMADRIRELPQSTRTAVEAARAVGCDVARIAKSLVFRRVAADAPLLVVTSGANRVDERHVGALLGETIEKADADFVRRTTGFAIGGVAPVGHTGPVLTLLDEDLVTLGDFWAAAGHPSTVFRLTASELLALTGARVVRVT